MAIITYTKNFLHKQFLLLRYQYIFCPKKVKPPLPSEMLGYVPQIYFFIYIFSMLQWCFSQKCDWQICLMLRMFIYLYIHFIFAYYLLKTMGVSSVFKCEDGMGIVKL